MHWGDYEAAVRAWPEQASGWMALADAQRQRQELRQAEESASHAAALTPSNWMAWSSLASLQWLRDEPDAARASMVRMAAVARTYSARWQYANLLLLTGDTQGYWRESAQALALAKDFEVERTLDQCANVAGNRLELVQVVAAARQLAPDASQRRLLSTTLLSYAADRQWWAVAASAWQALLQARHQAGEADLSQQAQGYLTALLEGGQQQTARKLWASARDAGLLPADAGPPADDAVTDGGFEHLGSGSPLGWVPCTDCGPRIFSAALGTPARLGGQRFAHALEMEFDGSEATDIQLARQRLLLLPSTRYRLQALAARRDSTGETGISLRVLRGARVCAQLAFPAGRDFQPSAVDFMTGADAGAAYDLQLVYARPLGQDVLQGTALLTGVSLREEAGSAATVCDGVAP
jgi:hypothetical protein